MCDRTDQVAAENAELRHALKEMGELVKEAYHEGIVDESHRGGDWKFNPSWEETLSAKCLAGIMARSSAPDIAGRTDMRLDIGMDENIPLVRIKRLVEYAYEMGAGEIPSRRESDERRLRREVYEVYAELVVEFQGKK